MRRSLVLVSVALVACGARSELPLFGEGGESTVGSGGTAGAPAMGCGELFVDGPPIDDTFDGWPYGGQSTPSLVAVDDTRVMLFNVFTDDTLRSNLRSTTFEAWGTWPSIQGPTHRIMDDIFPSPAVARGLGADAVALVWHQPPESPGAPFLVPSVTPSKDFPEPPGLPLDLGGAAGAPASIAASGGRIYVGYRLASGSVTLLAQLVTDASGNIVAGPRLDSGCAQGSGPAAVLAVDGAFLSAFATGRSWGACLNDDGIAGPPVRVQIERWSDGGAGKAALGAEWIAPEPIAVLALAPRPGGAWAVWQTDGSTGFQPPSVIATPLDSSGAVAGSEVVVVPDGTTSARVAAAALGDRLAVAWAYTSTPKIGVRLFRADGTLEAEGSVDTNSVLPSFPGEISLLASPAGDALVVGWTDFFHSANTVAARLRCRER